MKNTLFLLFLLCSSVSFAQSVASVDYDYFNVDNGSFYSSLSGVVQIQSGGHSGTVGYNEYQKLHPDYFKLYNVGLGYFYFGDEHMGGIFTNSSGNKPFSASHTYNALAFYGYSVYSKVLGTMEYPLPNGETKTFERKSQLYLGAAAASQKVFLNFYLVPVISYTYHGEMLIFRLGIPFNSFTITPSKQHKFEIDISFDTGWPAIRYEFTPTETDKLTLQYINEVNYFVIAEGGNREYGLVYEKVWFRGSYEHFFFDSIGLEAGVGYMPQGYYHAGYFEDFKRNNESKIAKETQYKVSLKAMF